MAPLLPHKWQARSMGLKLITVGVLALLMTIPAFFVERLIQDRGQRAAEVSQSIGSVLGGPQSFLGPILAIPYTLPDTSDKTDKTRRVDAGVYVFFPERGSADIVTKSEVRKRSLFKVPVYTAAIEFKASFDLPAAPVNLPRYAELDWARAEFLTGASDSRGALADATLTGGGTTKNMLLSGLSLNVPNTQELTMKLFGLRTGNTIRFGSKFDLAATMKFSGSQTISILPFAKTSTVAIRGDWPSPGFNGGFLPVQRTVTPTGFQAQWSIPFIARGVSSEGGSNLVGNLWPLAASVTFVEMANPYQSVTRSLKYVLLFLSFIFGAFFLFETTTGKRVHPAQYILIGVAQLIFYLLLLSVAERIGFDLAFAIAAVATVTLISVDANWIFASRKQGVRAFLTFSLVYGLIYVLLTLEDQALLIGSIVSFLAIAAIMYFTRSIDWYSQNADKTNP